MKRYLLSFLLFTTIAAQGQNHSSIKALVLDSLNKQPVGYVTIAVLKVSDSSLVSYTITDKTGTFTLRNLNTSEPLRLLISCVGYESLHISLHFKKDQPVTDLGQIYLTQKTLKEVVIKADRVPVIVKKDTIEFDAEAFKVRPNAVVEDLLKKLPGVQVDNSGTITVNGKGISKIKIDGKTFFANDPTIATRNLDADMISKVQVYDDRDDDPDHLVPDYQVKKIINLKFKKAFKKSVIGNVEAGAGTQDRYESSAFLSKFHDDFQLSGSINSDNLSGTKLFIQDMHLPTAALSSSGGTDESNRANVNFNDKIGKDLQLNIEYELNDRVSNQQQTGQQQQFIADTVFTTNSNSNHHNHAHDQGLHIKTEWKPDTATIIKFNPDLIYSYNGSNSIGNSIASTNFVPMLNQNFSTDHSTDNSLQYQQNFNYYRRLNKKGASFNIGSALNIHPDKSIDYSYNNLISYSAALPSDTISRSGKNTATDYSGSISAGFHDPVSKKLSLDIAVTGYHDRNEGDLITYDEDFKTGLYTIFNAEQSSDLVRYIWQQTAHPDLTYNFSDKVSLKAGFAAELQQIDNHFSSNINDLDQHFAYVLPAAELHINNINITYSEDVRQPAINDLQPITITYSPLYTFIGNPQLKPTRFHTGQLGFNHYYTESQLFVGLNARTTIETNTIVRERSVSAEGATVTTPINRNGRFTTGFNANLSKSFKKQGEWTFHTSSNINFITGHNFFEVNQQDGYQNTSAIIFSQEFAANWNDLLELRPRYSINSAITKYQLVDYSPSSYTSQAAGLIADLFLPKKFVWSMDYSYNYTPLVAPGFQRSSNLLSLSVAKHVQKQDKGEFRLTCYDIFNQGVSHYHYASENTINDTQTILLRRYFLISYSYRFSKVTTK